MKITETLKVTDYKKIKKVHFTNPELMADDAEEKVKELYYNLFKTEEGLSNARTQVRELESKVEALKVNILNISKLFTLEYETYDKEYTKETEGFGIRGLGNSTLGEQSVI